MYIKPVINLMVPCLLFSYKALRPSDKRQLSMVLVHLLEPVSMLNHHVLTLFLSPSVFPLFLTSKYMKMEMSSSSYARPFLFTSASIPLSQRSLSQLYSELCLFGRYVTIACQSMCCSYNAFCKDFSQINNHCIVFAAMTSGIAKVGSDLPVSGVLDIICCLEG